MSGSTISDNKVNNRYEKFDLIYSGGYCFDPRHLEGQSYIIDHSLLLPYNPDFLHGNMQIRPPLKELENYGLYLVESEKPVGMLLIEKK